MYKDKLWHLWEVIHLTHLYSLRMGCSTMTMTRTPVTLGAVPDQKQLLHCPKSFLSPVKCNLPKTKALLRQDRFQPAADVAEFKMVDLESQRTAAVLPKMVQYLQEVVTAEVGTCISDFIPLACAECDHCLPFSGASSIPLCYVLFPAILLHQLFFHSLSLRLAIYFLVYAGQLHLTL